MIFYNKKNDFQVKLKALAARIKRASVAASASSEKIKPSSRHGSDRIRGALPLPAFNKTSLPSLNKTS